MTEAERELLSLVIGHRIRESRKALRYSQSDLALGVVSQSMMSLIESGRQLPLPDILQAIARRLNDEILEHYAKLLENQQLSLADMSSLNQEDLVRALCSHRGQWQDVHIKIGLQLCQHYYYCGNHKILQDICLMIMNHRTTGPAYGQSCFYYGSSLLCQYHYEEAETWLRKAEQHMDKTDRNFIGRLYYNLGFAYTQLDVQVLAMWYAKSAVDEFFALHDFVRHGKSLALLGVVQDRLGKSQEALNSLTLAFDILSKWGMSVTDKVRILCCLGDICEALNKFDKAEEYCHQAMAEAPPDHQDYVGLSGLYRTLSIVNMKKGNPDAAASYLKKAVQLAELSADTWTIARTYLLSSALAETTRERIKAAQRAYDITLKTNNHILHALAAETLAKLLRSERQYETAEAYTHAALKSYREYVAKNSMFAPFIQLLPFRDDL